jgi:hypothetical protein
MELNVTKNTTIVIEHDIFAVVLGFYLPALMSYSGAVLNFICVLIFIKIVRNESANQGNLFKYLLTKSIFDFFFCLQNMPQMFYFRADFTTSKSYLMQLWYMYCFYFLYPLTSQLSVWFEIAATIDCLCLILRKLEFHKTKLCFWVVTTTTISVSIVFYIPLLFWFKIEKHKDGGFYPKATKLGTSRAISYYHTLVHNIFRDILPVFISILLNATILYCIRQMTTRRKRMASLMNAMSNQTSRMVKRAQRAEKSKIKMMFFTSLIHVFHVPVIFYNFNMFNVKSNSFLVQLCLVSISVSYFIPIILYTAFNNTFRNYMSKIFFCSIYEKFGTNSAVSATTKQQ